MKEYKIIKSPKRFYNPLNCSKCGRFIGKNGFTDCGYDADGIPDIGYPLCKRCLDLKDSKKSKKV